MTRSRKSPSRRAGKPASAQLTRHSKKEQEPDLQSRLLALLADEQKPFSTSAILERLDLPRAARGEIKEILDRLVQQQRLEKSHKQYLLASDSGLLRGILALTSRGFGFVRLDKAKPGEKEIFIAQRDLAGASHGDTVMIQAGALSRGRREGRIVRIVQRAYTSICGIYTVSGRSGFVTPDNEKLPFSVLIGRGLCLGARNGVAVLAEITDYGSGRKGPEGKIIEILGDPLHPSVQIRMAMEQFSLRRKFPEEVLLEAEGLVALTSCEDSRRDLRDIAHVTIDGATARDFDDAICVNRTRNGFRLYVSIADVSHYVQPGSALDKEAWLRGTSVYLPDRVLPMLPERLSNNLCSLVPREDRPAFTAILDFDRHGKRIKEEYCKSLIHSRQRFTYDTVNEIIYLKNKKLQSEHKELLPMLEAAAGLVEALHNQRMARGSLDFTIPEPEIKLEGQTIKAVQRAERNNAHRLIEECMLAANEAVAETLEKQNQPVLYRIHEKPDPEKVGKFVETAQGLGLSLPPLELVPAWFAAVLRAAGDSPASYVVNNLLLRTMQQARYAPDNVGHFGLAAEFYLHFTSPIRRYPDLVAHRALQALLSGGKKKQKLLPGDNSLLEAGVELSRLERISVDVERNVQARLAVLFLQDRIGEEFAAIISGVTTFGLFVELLDFFISGAVPITDLGAEYYFHDAKSHRMTGEMTGTTYQIGALVLVRLERTDILSKKLTFSIVPEKAKDSTFA